MKESEWQIFAVSPDGRHEGEGSEERGREAELVEGRREIVRTSGESVGGGEKKGRGRRGGAM